MTRGSLAFAAAAYAVLVAHLLFIPYAYAPLPFDEALGVFARLPWLELGSDQNVALVSRALMFLPLGLLIAASLAPRPIGPVRYPSAVLAIVVGGLWAGVVNFAQLWFPGRTASLNNVVAEVCGVAFGALLWCFLGVFALKWWKRLSAGGFVSLRAALGAYVVLYLIASMSPFDFVTSADELAEKIASGNYAIWTTAGGCGPAPCALKYLVSLLAAIPCGWWFAGLRRQPPPSRGLAWTVALALAVSIEVLHFFMVSGVSQGASVVLRAAGLLAGFEAYSLRTKLRAIPFDRFARPMVLVLLPAYLSALTYVGGWARSGFLGVSAGLARLNDFAWLPPPDYRAGVIVWMPFYYQYYEGYQSTMQSTMLHAALYAPVGAACWLWVRRRDRVSLWIAALLAAALALVMETSKLFLDGRHPDYTDVFLAVVSASATLLILRLASRTQQREEGDKGGAASDAARRMDGAGRVAAIDSALVTNPFARVVGLLALVVAAVTVIDFPIARLILAVGLAGYALLLFRNPTAYLVAIPALLPVLDLAPWSGRFYWDEFDALLAVTIGTRLVMGLPMRRFAVPLPKIALGLLLLSAAVSTVIGVWPPPPLDANAFSNYLSNYNALRVAKGYGWAAVLLWLIVRDTAAGRAEVPTRLMVGLTAGLATTAAGVFWERLSFLGAPEMDGSFRAAGMVSATHVGGAYLEAILVMLTPFALAMVVTAQRRPVRILALSAVAMGAVATLMTVSRAAYAAWFAAVATFGLVWFWRNRVRSKARESRPWGWRTVIALLAVIMGMAVAAHSTYLRDRIAMSSADLSVRLTHWKTALGLMPSDAQHVLFGMGLGSFPREFYLARAGTDPLPAYRVERGVGTEPPYLVLIGRQGLYLDQRVDARPGGELILTGRVRSPQKGAALGIGLCAKSLLNSVGCAWASAAADTAWKSFEVRLLVPRRNETGGSLPLPISLSLSTVAPAMRIEVTRLSLRESANHLLVNGDFEQGLDYWFVTSDVHLAWRALSTPLQTLIEQGLLGGLAWLLLGGAAVGVLRVSATKPGIGLAFVAAIVGFITVGIFDSLLDAPRIIVLFGAICAALASCRRASQGTVLSWRNWTTSNVSFSAN